MKDTRRQRATYIDADTTPATEQIVVYRPPPARKQRVAQPEQSWGRVFNLLLFLIAALGVLVMLWLVWPTPATIEQPTPRALPTAAVEVQPVDVTVRDPQMPRLLSEAYRPELQPARPQAPLPTPRPVWLPLPVAVAPPVMPPVQPVVNSAPPVSAEPPQVEQVVQPVDAPVAVEPNVSKPSDVGGAPREILAGVVEEVAPITAQASEGSAHHGVRPTVVACALCHPVPEHLKGAK